MTMEQRVEELLGKLTLKEKVSLLSGRDVWNTVPIERLGIPAITMTDGPHGVRAIPESGRIAGPATCFPTGVSMASTWNPDLVERVGQALGEETRGMGCDILLGPCVNIVRGPLAGRNFEAYAEDPYLAGRTGVAWVKGVQSRGVGASLKHYACNNHEIERFRSSSNVDERTLREIYLPAFEATVKEAQPWTVMCSYNRINGVYASQHDYLLNKILRDEWGFQGLVVSDWAANHTVFESVAGGLDLEMPGPEKYYGRLLAEAVQNWQIDESAVDNAVRRILRTILLSGKLDDPAAMPAGAVNTPAHQSLARELAEEAITLLKNDGVLPLDKSKLKSIAVIGPNAADARIGGGGSSFVEPPYRVSPLEGLQAKLGAVQIEYEQGCDNFNEPSAIRRDWLTLPDGSGLGVLGEYFTNDDFSGEPDKVQLDRRPDVWWFVGLPSDPAKDKYSARWTTNLTVPSDGVYLFSLGHAGVCRVVVDGALAVESQAPNGATFDASFKAVTFKRELEGGRPHALKIEYVKYPGQDVVHYSLKLAKTYAADEDDRIMRAVALARRCDVALLFVGMPEGYETEGTDRPDMDIPGRQNELIAAVAQANPNTVVVLNAGAPVAMPWVDQVPALLEAYYPGQECGHAVANILFGDVNPSGKLPVTFPKRLEDNPTFVNSTYPGAREINYGEGIFVGYRWYDKRDIEPLFPFGFGLSYTTFEYGEAQVLVKGKAEVEVAVKVRNTGQVAGQEVVQVYVADKKSSLPRPPQELKRFAKVALAPGEAKEVRFTLDRRALSFYDPYRKQWVAEPGEFDLLIGSSSRDIRAQAAFTLE